MPEPTISTPVWNELHLQTTVRPFLGATGPLKSLRAVILLSGSIWPLPWHNHIGRAVLDLPLAPDVTLLGHWTRQVDNLARAIDAPELALRVVLSRASPIPSAHGTGTDARVRVRVERDAMDYRGTGGVLSDLAREYNPQDYLLVASAGQVLLENLESLARALARHDGDLVFLVGRDGTPGNLMLVRCALLRQIPALGFVDFKEQALPELARRHQVHLLQRPAPATILVLTAADYLAAVRQYQLRHPAARNVPGRDFSIVERSAHVDEDSLLQNSVVLLGARVGRKVVLVRSIVCEHAQARDGLVAVDQIIIGRGGGRSLALGANAAAPALARLRDGWSPEI